MEVTRNVILDLLPLYLADEVSEDTRILVNKYLEVDMELAEIAKQKLNDHLLRDFPAPNASDRELQLYREAKNLMFWRTVIIAAVITFALFILLLIAALGLFALSFRL